MGEVGCRLLERNLAHCYFRPKNIERAKYLASLILDGGRLKISLDIVF